MVDHNSPPIAPLYGSFGWAANTRFCDIWKTAESFVSEYKSSGLYDGVNIISDTSATTLFYLLYAKYGNDSIASFDRTRFKYGVFSIIFQFGPTWEKRLAMQKELRDLSLEEIQRGSTGITNHAYNPGTAPSTATLTELTAINEQTTQHYKKGPLDGYNNLIELLKTDVSSTFLNRFQPLFQRIVMPVQPLYYTEYTEDESEEQ